MALYSDLNQYDPTSKAVLEDEEAVFQALNNLLEIYIFQRIFEPEIGNQLQDMLMEPLDGTSAKQILRIILQLVNEFEPRVKLVYSKTKIVPDYDNNTYDITLAFRIKGLGETVYEISGSLERNLESE